MHSRFACGASNLVLEVSFSDSTYWVVRIRFPDVDEDPEVEKAMQSEVATMRLIQERTSIPVSTIFGYNAKQRNPFGYSFMFMSVLPGRHLDSHLAFSVPKRQQAKVAGQLAEILHQLNTRMTFEMIGRIWCGEGGNEEPSITSFNAVGAREGQLETYPIGPVSTSLEYFYALRQHENAAIRAGILQGTLGQDDKKMWFTACRVFEQTLSQLVLMEKMAGPFPLKHMDLHFNNILFDDDFNITGILDWTAAQTVPCESFAVYVEFIVSPNAPEEVSVRTSSFRNMVQRAWKERELKSNCVCSISDVLGSVRGDLIHFSYTLGALRRSVAYAQIVTALLYGPGFSLNNFKKNWGVPPV
jgi:aminoglycoside phosphotransferase (APT) family kinase protein